MNYTTPAAVFAASYGVNSLVFGVANETAMKDGAQMAFASVASGYVADSLVSVLPSSLSHMVGSIGTAGVYAAVDSYTNISPINSLTGKLLFAVGTATLGDALVGIVENGTISY